MIRLFERSPRPNSHRPIAAEWWARLLLVAEGMGLLLVVTGLVVLLLTF